MACGCRKTCGSFLKWVCGSTTIVLWSREDAFSSCLERESSSYRHLTLALCFGMVSWLVRSSAVAFFVHVVYTVRCSIDTFFVESFTQEHGNRAAPARDHPLHTLHMHSSPNVGSRDSSVGAATVQNCDPLSTARSWASPQFWTTCYVESQVP